MSAMLTVIICSYNRYDSLESVLSHLLEVGGVVPGTHDILVVENTPPVLRLPIDTRGGRLRVVICEETGLSAARNCGIANSDSALIAFLDDDALVSKNWCKNIVRAFAGEPAAQVIGGKVVPKYLGTLPAWYDETLSGYLSCVDWGDKARFLNPGEWIVGANMCFRREVFETFGGFDTKLGRKGTASLLSNEELALFERIGVSHIWYDPDLLVEHVIAQERISLSWFRKRVYWQAVSDMVSGAVDGPAEELAKEYGVVISSLEPEHRNLKCMSFLPKDFERFRLQLRAIYLSAVMSGDGFARAL